MEANLPFTKVEASKAISASARSPSLLPRSGRRDESSETTIITTPPTQIMKGVPIPKRSGSKPLSGCWWLMAVPAILISAYGAVFIFGTPPGDPTVKSRIMSTPWGILHVVCGALSVAIGPFQFLRGLRRRRPAVHRWVGRMYVTTVAVSGVCAANVAKSAKCFTVGRYGFAVLALLWLASIWMGVRTIWRGDVAQHREWMMRNYALTYAAVMLRWQFGLFIFMGSSSEMALTMVAFTSWIPNSLYAEWWIRRRPMLPR